MQESKGTSRVRIERELERAFQIASLPFREPRFFTACVICDILPYEWFTYIEMLRPVPEGEHDPVAPGVRNAAIHAIGDLLVNDRPLERLAAEGLERRFRKFCIVQGRDSRKKPSFHQQTDGDTGRRIPYLILHRAAEALEILTG